jgi:hypothetical protein
MATPASLFRPGAQPEPLKVTLASPSEHEATPNTPRDTAYKAASKRAASATGESEVMPGIVLAPSAGAVEFDTVIAASGQLTILSAVQRIRMGTQRGGQRAHVWADEHSIHILIDAQLVKTVPSNLTAEDLHQLRMRGARPAAAPPAAPSPAATGTLAAGAVIEVDRCLDINGVTGVAGHRLKVGAELAGKKVTLRLDGHLIHVVHDGVLAKTLPCPLPADQRTTIRGARIATTQLPAPIAGPISVQRKVPADGVIMVARQRLRVGRAYAAKIVTVHVEDTHFRITCDGRELSLHPRNSQLPVRRWKAKIHALKL